MLPGFAPPVVPDPPPVVPPPEPPEVAVGAADVAVAVFVAGTLPLPDTLAVPAAAAPPAGAAHPQTTTVLVGLPIQDGNHGADHEPGRAQRTKSSSRIPSSDPSMTA